jgi:hypothetical protein
MEKKVQNINKIRHKRVKVSTKEIMGGKNGKEKFCLSLSY